LTAFITSALGASIDLPIGDVTQSIQIRAGGATHWRQGAYEVWVLRGAVQIEQGTIAAKSEEGVLWIERAEAYSGRPSKVIAYLEGKVQVHFAKSAATSRSSL